MPFETCLGEPVDSVAAQKAKQLLIQMQQEVTSKYEPLGDAAVKSPRKHEQLNNVQIEENLFSSIVIKEQINNYKQLVNFHLEEAGDLLQESSRFGEETNSQADDESSIMSFNEQQRFDKLLEQKSKVFTLVNPDNLDYSGFNYEEITITRTKKASVVSPTVGSGFIFKKEQEAKNLANSKSSKVIMKGPPKSAMYRKSKKINELQPILVETQNIFKSEVANALHLKKQAINDRNSLMTIIEPIQNRIQHDYQEFNDGNTTS